MRAISVDFRPPSALRTTAVAMGVLAAAGITAPAALAAGDDPLDEAGTTVPEAGSENGEVLTPSPERTMSDEETDGADFGLGKIDMWATVAPDVVFAEGSSLPDGAVLDRTGAKLRLVYTQWNGNDTANEDSFPDGPPELTCTWDELDADGNGNLCDFTGDSVYINADGEARLDPFTTFTLELVEAPISGQVQLPAAAGRVRQGSTFFDTGPFPVVFEAPGAYRQIGVTLTDAAGEAVTDATGATFELCTVAGSTCAPSDAEAATVVSTPSTATGRLLFPGWYVPGTYRIRQTASADGSPFSSAPRTLTVAAPDGPADSTTPVLLSVALRPVTGAAGASDSPGTTTPAGATPSATTPPSATPSTATPSAAAVGTPVAAASAVDGELASTGVEPLPILALGAGLALAGGAVIVAARRRAR